MAKSRCPRSFQIKKKAPLKRSTRCDLGVKKGNNPEVGESWRGWTGWGFFFSLGVRENFGLFGGGLLMYAPQRQPPLLFACHQWC